MKTFARVLVLVAALSTVVSMVFAILAFQAAGAALQRLDGIAPTRCIGYAPAQTKDGQPLLVPINLCAQRAPSSV